MINFNWPIIGHKKAVQFLQKSMANGKLAHAYLFSGAAHLGKSLLADYFSASILCNDYHLQSQAKPAALPCQKCVFCQQFNRGIHPDVYFLKKEEEKKNISVEQVREMHKFLSLTSFLNSYKIALIPNAQDLSESAQNSLLKVLEEPAPKTILILLANDYNLLLPTIISRCQLIKLRPLCADNIFDHLISLGAERSQANAITALANGHIGLAIDYFKKPDFFNLYLEKTGRILGMFEQDLTSRFRDIGNIFVDSKNNTESVDCLLDELGSWQLILRDILMAKNNLNNLLVNTHYGDKINKISKNYSIPRVLKLLAQIKKINHYLRYNVNPRLAAENLIINL